MNYEQSLCKEIKDVVNPKILARIQDEENLLENKPKEEKEKKAFGGFAERRSK